ncbi:MAG: hypothetical protein JNN12_04170 [Bacteroidetes Order II. Incertae sedis bacterium]|nr:hypothetical protein [Bacteroidetes Order II. bacterium]
MRLVSFFILFPAFVLAQSADTQMGQVRTTDATELVRDLTTRVLVSSIPKKQKLPVITCVQTSPNDDSQWVWTKWDGQFGYVSVKTISPERGTKLECRPFQRLAQAVYDVEQPKIEAEVAQRSNRDRPFLDTYLSFVWNTYLSEGMPVIQELNVYAGDKANTLNLYFKTLNCHPKQPVKNLKLWVTPIDHKNKTLTAATKTMTVKGPFDPGCATSEFKFMGIPAGKNPKDAKLTRIEFEYADGKKVQLRNKEVEKVLGCGLKKEICLAAFDRAYGE